MAREAKALGIRDATIGTAGNALTARQAQLTFKPSSATAQGSQERGTLVAGSKVAVLGDSIFARSLGFTTAATRTTGENRANGELHWAGFLSPRFRHANWWDPTATQANLVPTYAAASEGDPLWRGANFGLSADTATGTTRRTEQVIASGAHLCVYSAGTNVGVDDATVAATLNSIQTAVSALVAGGVRVVLGTVRPRRVSETPVAPEISPASMQRIRDINTSIRANWRTWGASALWDPWEALRDPQFDVNDPLYGSILPAYAIADGVHLSPRGAWTSAQSLSNALNEVIQPKTWFNADPTVANLMTGPKGRFEGTAGFAQNGITGTAPTGWVATNVALTTVTGTSSLAANAETKGQTWELVLTSSGAGLANTYNTTRISPSPVISTGFTSTDWVSAFWEVEIVGDPVLVQFQATLGQGSTISNRGMWQSTAAYNDEPSPAIENNLAGWVITEPLLVEARTSLNPRLDVILRQDMAGTCTIRLRRHLTRIVEDPQTTFPWVP